MEAISNAVFHRPSLRLVGEIEIAVVADEVGVIEPLEGSVILSGIWTSRGAWCWIEVGNCSANSWCIRRNNEVREIGKGSISLDFSGDEHT